MLWYLRRYIGSKNLAQLLDCNGQADRIELSALQQTRMRTSTSAQ